MSLPAAVTDAWTRFARCTPFDEIGDEQWSDFTEFVVSVYEAKLSYSDVEELLIEGTSVDGAPDFIAGELAAGLEVGLRVLRRGDAAAAREAALAKLSPEERKALGL